MKFVTRFVSGVLILLGMASSHAASPWSVRLRATYLSTVDKSDAFSALGIKFGADTIATNDKLIPEIDIDYAFTETLGAEVGLSVPQTQEVTLAGIGKLGTFKHLPPTVMLQYRANPAGAIRPYVGLGVNYTLIWDTNLAVAGVPLHLEHDSVGLAAQVGIDWKIADRWSVNFDLRRIGMQSKVYVGSTVLTTARLDPWLFAAGIRYQF